MFHSESTEVDLLPPAARPTSLDPKKTRPLFKGLMFVHGYVAVCKWRGSKQAWTIPHPAICQQEKPPAITWVHTDRFVRDQDNSVKQSDLISDGFTESFKPYRIRRSMRARQKNSKDSEAES